MATALPVVRVLFLLQRPEAWVNLASVWNAMYASAVFDPTLWVLPYDFSNSSLSATKAALLPAYLDQEGVPYVEWRPGMRPGIGDFDSAIFNHPYDRERPPELWFAAVAAAIPHTVYIPYGLAMGGGRKNLRLQFAQPTQTGATAIIARSHVERHLYSRHCPAGDRHVYVLGHPRFDRPSAGDDDCISAQLGDAIGGRTVLLWNSHFSFGHRYSQSSNFSTFDLLGPELFEFALTHSADFCLLWRPHPRLLAAVVEEGLLMAKELGDLRLELAACGIVLDETASHMPAFRASHALMTDAGSFLLEYLRTGKPVLATINHEGEPLNDEALLLISHYATARRPEEVEAFLISLISGEVNQPLEHAREIHLPMMDGRAGERVANLIFNLHQDRATNEKAASAAKQVSPAPNCKPARPDHFSTRQAAAMAATPTLSRLCDGLRNHRTVKAMEPKWRKNARRKLNTARVEIAEWIKRHSVLLRMTQ